MTIQELYQKAQEYLLEWGYDVEIVENNLSTVTGAKGICVNCKAGTSFHIDVEQFLEDMRVPLDHKQAAITVARQIYFTISKELPFKLKEEDIRDYTKMKEYLIPVFGPRDRDYKDLVREDFAEDFTVLYKFVLPTTAEDVFSPGIPVTHEMIEYYQISEEQLREDAMRNLMKTPATIQSMMENMFGITIENEVLFIACTQDTYGANVLLQPGFLESVYQELGCNFFVLPSSIHEVLLLKDEGDESLDKAKDVVRSANQEDISVDNFLSNTIYYYDGQTKEFDTADRLLQRERT